MKLIDLLVRDLPWLGGWRDGAEAGAQDYGGEFCFFANSDIALESLIWGNNEDNALVYKGVMLTIAEDWNTAIITREQYEEALAVAGGPAIRNLAERRRKDIIAALLKLQTITSMEANDIYDAIAEGKIPGVRLEDEAGR